MIDTAEDAYEDDFETYEDDFEVLREGFAADMQRPRSSLKIVFTAERRRG
jgi:hypothetical protein